jgi:hypothetical protein
VGGRPGSGLPEEPVLGVRAGRPGCRVVPRLPSRALGCGGRGALGVFLQAAEVGIADLAFERAEGFFRGFAFGQFLVVVGAALGVRQRIWVTAAMWMAWLSRRLPRLESRQAFWPPEETSMGAVPL